MRFRTSLRYRVTVAFALLGLLISMVLATALYILSNAMEERLIVETLSAELEESIARYTLDPDDTPIITTTIRKYVISADTEQVPVALQTMEEGLHHIRLEGRHYFAQVQFHEGLRFVALYDDRQLRRREYQINLFLSGGVIVMTLLSALLGFWLAGRVIAPVRSLVERVSGHHPVESPSTLAEHYPDDEVGMLAREFDDYLQRLGAFIEREQAFTADVSHELRTPLTVIEGATDVLLDDQSLTDVQRRRVERIARSACEMSELVTALLILAREEQGDVSESGCVVAEVLQQVVIGHHHLLQHKPVEIRLDIRAETILPAECTLLRVVLANLLRNAICYTDQGQVTIRLDKQGVAVQDTGIGIPDQQLQRIFERYYTGPSGNEGIGLSLVKRICQRYGWQIDVSSREGQGTEVMLTFNPRPD